MKLILAVLFVLATLPAQAQIVWHAATEYPASAMPGEGLTTLARLVAEKTGNKLQLVPDYDAPGGLRSATIPAAVQSGQIEVGDTFAGAIVALNPVFQLSSLPFVATTQDQAWRLYKVAKPAYIKAFETNGQRLLYATPWPNTGLWTRTRLHGPDSLQHLAVRTYDAASTEVLRNAGADAVEYSFADAMPHLRDGSVVAVLSSGDGGAGRKLWDFMPYFTAIGYAAPLSLTTVNAAAYEALSPEMKTQLDVAAAETEAAQWQLLTKRTERNYAAMRNNGVTINMPTPDVGEALTKAAESVIRQWRRTAGPAANLLDAYRP